MCETRFLSSLRPSKATGKSVKATSSSARISACPLHHLDAAVKLNTANHLRHLLLNAQNETRRSAGVGKLRKSMGRQRRVPFVTCSLYRQPQRPSCACNDIEPSLCSTPVPVQLRPGNGLAPAKPTWQLAPHLEDGASSYRGDHCRKTANYACQIGWVSSSGHTQI